MYVTYVKLAKNTLLGSIKKIDNLDSIHEVSWEKIWDAKNEPFSITAQNPQSQKLIPAFPKCSHFQYMPMTIVNQLPVYGMQIFHKTSEINLIT